MEGKLSLIKRKHNVSQNYRTGSTHFGLCCQTPGGTSSLSFAAKGTLTEKSEGHWLHFLLGPGEGSFHSKLQGGRGNSFKFLHIIPEEQSFASWNIPSQNLRNCSPGQAYLTSMTFLSSEEIRTKRKQGLSSSSFLEAHPCTLWYASLLLIIIQTWSPQRPGI